MVDDLTLLQCLGKGSYGEVFLTSKQGKSELFATKKMLRSYADQPQVSKYLKNEIAILKELNHKNVVKLEDVKITQNHYYLVMEYCNGGALSDCLKKYKKMYGTPFPEEIVQYLMRQIIDAIRYIHNKKIIHRDLKLDNILVHFNSEQDKNNLNMMRAIIKIIDFGFATHIGSLQLCYTTLGSPINMDPNILKKMTDKQRGKDDGKKVGYDQKADIWSLGTICYEMLIGKSAFNSQSMEELVKKVESGSYSIPTNLSKEVVSFLNGMLQYNAKNRLNADELARHQFLVKNIRDFEKIDVRKVSNKVNQNNLNVNIKRNQTIWSIFNTEDEDKLINIPGNLVPMDTPIREDYNARRPPSPPNRRRNTEKIPHIPNPYKDFPNNDDNQYEINKQRTQKFQNYGGYNNMSGYTSMDGREYGYPNNQNYPPMAPPNYPPSMQPPNYPQRLPPPNYPPSMPPSHYPPMSSPHYPPPMSSPHYPPPMSSPHYPPTMSSPHFPYSMTMVIPPSIPTLGDFEPEDVRMMRRPEGGPNEENGYGFSSGIFQANPPFNRGNGYGGGYGYGYGY